MAKDKKKFEEAPIIPGTELSAQWAMMHEGKKGYMMAHMGETLLDYFGIDTAKEETMKDPKGNLKIFELTDTGEMKNPFEDCKPDSEAFLQKIDKGRIFALPPGQKDPVQMQINEKTEIAFSRPVPETLFKKPKPLSRWVTLTNRFFGWYKKDVAKFKADQTRYENSKKASDAISESRDPESEEMQKEKTEFTEAEQKKEAAEAQAEKEVEQERLKADIDAYESDLDRSMKIMQEIYGARPVMHEDQLNCQYTKEQFDLLKPYDIEGITINEYNTDKKMQLTDKQFASLSVLKALTPGIGGKIRASEGVSSEVTLAANNTFYTSDLYGWGNRGRANVGDYFKDAQAPARDQTMQALEEYKKGNKEPLGRLIGEGLHFCATKLSHRGLDNMSNMGLNGLAAEAITLLDADSDLKAYAMDPSLGGLTEKDIQTVRMDKELVDLYRADAWARGQIQKAKETGTELDPETRRKCIEARLKYEAINHPIKAEIAKKENSPEFWEKGAEIMQMRNPIDKAWKEKSALYNSGKMSEKEFVAERKAYTRAGEAVTAVSQVMMEQFIGTPEMYSKIGEGISQGKSLDELAGGLVRQTFPGRKQLEQLSVEELENALKPDNLFAENSPYTKQPEQAVPEKAPAVEKTVQQQNPEQQKNQQEPQKEGQKDGISREQFNERLSVFNGPAAGM